MSRFILHPTYLRKQPLVTINKTKQNITKKQNAGSTRIICNKKTVHDIGTLK